MPTAEHLEAVDVTENGACPICFHTCPLSGSRRPTRVVHRTANRHDWTTVTEDTAADAATADLLVEARHMLTVAGSDYDSGGPFDHPRRQAHRQHAIAAALVSIAETLANRKAT